MSLPRWTTILDGLWLALSGAAALAVALDLGARVGLRAWSSGDAVLTAQAAAPRSRPVPGRPGSPCRDAAADVASATARESPVRSGGAAGTRPAPGP
jgi:hypothetical protein